MASTTFRAIFKQLTVGSDIKLVLTLDPTYIEELPTLTKLANDQVMVGMQSAQTELDLGDE